MKPSSLGHVESPDTLCTLLAGGLVLFLWLGTALAQQLDPAEVTHREYQEFIVATGREAPEHWQGGTLPHTVPEDFIALIRSRQ